MRVELERERVAEVAEDEVEEALRRALEVEDVGPAIHVGQQQVGHLLQAGDEAEEVPGLIVAAVVLGEHPPEVEATRLRPRGAEPGERRAVVGREDDVAEEVRDAERHDLVHDVRGHLGVEREQHDAAIDNRSDDGHRHSRRCLRRQDEARAAREQDGLVEGDAHGLLRERLRSDDPRRRAVLDDERVHLVDGGGATHRLPGHAHGDRGEARHRDDRMQHDAKRVRRLRGAGERAGEGGGDLRQRAAVEGQHPVDPDVDTGSVHAVRAGVDQLEGERGVDGHAGLARARVTVHDHQPRRAHDERDAVDVERGKLERAHAGALMRSPARGARLRCARPTASRHWQRGP